MHEVEYLTWYRCDYNCEDLPLINTCINQSHLLQSIGCGYGKRLTFEGDSACSNDNYFWSDTHPEGCGFAIQALLPGDSFRYVGGAGGEDTTSSG